MSLADLPLIDAERLTELLTWRRAIDGLADAVAQPAPDAAPRTAFGCAAGELLLMPAESSSYVGVKVISLNHDAPAGFPRAQGIYTLFDARSLSPVALLDAVELTAIRTAAVSALAVERLAPEAATRLVVMGTGPQAVSHARAIAAIRDLSDIRVVGRRSGAVAEICETLTAHGLPAAPGAVADLAEADIVACCTASPEPLFDSAVLTPEAVVTAIGSHHPDRREVDAALVRDAFVVVESRDSALREAGDIIMAGDQPAELIDASLAELVTGSVRPPAGRRLFKSVGEAWEDLALASLAFELDQA